LHGFTHAYATLLVPLYLSIATDLHLAGVRSATLIVTIYGAVYMLCSYGAGVLSDRFDRKVLLGIGLLGNAVAIIGIGLSRDYGVILALAVAAGVFGTLFHPSANALAPSHYPKSPGMAIGLLGIGTGLGFFFGPQFGGWRTRAATWHFGQVAQWQKPCVELGILGLVIGIIFLFVAHDPNTIHARKQRAIMPPGLKKHVAQLASVLMFRDFAGVATISLASIYLQRVFHMTVETAGLSVGLMMLPCVVLNPLGVYFSTGNRRLPALAFTLLLGGCVAGTIPLWNQRWVVPLLCVFMTLQFTSYSLSDAAMLERVDPNFRGRVVGLFLLIAGTFGALGPWVMGAWTDWLGPWAGEQSAYFGPFGLVAICMIVSAFGPRLIARLGAMADAPPISPMQEIAPETMGMVP
jgi:MFS family permease